MQRLFIILISVTFLKTTIAHAQNTDTAVIDALIKDIASLQVTSNGEFYKGMFPGYRQCGGAPHNYQPDNNVFFTAISAFAFRDMLPYFKGDNKILAEKIISNASSSYQHYKSQFGDPFYNFWPVHSPIMPRSYYFKYLKSVFGQGEDADDSVLILMTTENDDSSNVTLKKRLIEVSNLSRNRTIISTFKKYRNIPAYSTYLGLRMPPDFDFAVQCNIMYFMFDKHLPFTRQDSATIYLLSEMVRNRDYIKAPVYISPYYVKPSILLYHLTRLMGTFSIPELEKYKSQLSTDIHQLLEKSSNIMDQIILRTSLLRLGERPPELELRDIKTFEQSNQQQYIFFQARAAFSYPTPFKQVFLHWSYITYYFRCPAYNKILWLEYLVEKNKK